MRMYSLARLILLMTVTATSARAADPAPSHEEGLDWLRVHLTGMIRADQKLADIRKVTAQLYLQSDVDGTGVSQRSYDLQAEINRAQQRANRVQQWASYDLDGDGKVTREEVAKVRTRQALQSLRPGGVDISPTKEQIAKVLEPLVDEAMKDDLDGDGVITLDEVYRAFAQNQQRFRNDYWRTGLIPLSLDTNGDGVVSREEFDAAVAIVLKEIDTDGNGIISIEEAAKHQAKAQQLQIWFNQREQKRLQIENARQKAAACGFPKVPEGAKFVAVGNYDGRATSSVAIGSDDEETRAGLIEIEPGTEPLFIVASSFNSMIWIVKGDVGRVAGFVASSVRPVPGSKKPSVGVVGLPKERVSFPATSDCLNYWSEASPQAAEAKVTLEAAFDRPVDEMSGTYSLGKVSLPSGKLTPDAPFPNTRLLPTVGASVSTWHEMLRYTPAGVADIDPAKVVASAPARTYAVLPQQAGLAQLIEDGSIVPAGQSTVTEIGTTRIVGVGEIVTGGRPVKSYTIPGSYKIIKPTRFPAGLNGGYSVKFVLAKGVPYPEGSPGHSNVISEETGETLAGPGMPRVNAPTKF